MIDAGNSSSLIKTVGTYTNYHRRLRKGTDHNTESTIHTYAFVNY